MWQEAAEARKPRETAWKEAYKRADPSYVDETKVKGPFKLKAPYTYRTLEMQTASLLEASKANGRWIIAQPTMPEYRKAGPVVSQLLENQFRQKSSDINLNNETAADAVARMGLLYGNAYFKVEWRRTQWWWGCRLIPVDPFDLFPDWKHGRFYIFSRVVTLAELDDIVNAIDDDGTVRKNFKKLYNSIRRGEVTGFLHDSYVSDHSRRRQEEGGRVEGSDDLTDAYAAASDDPYNARIELIEYHETRDDGIVAQIVPNVGKRIGGTDVEDLVIRKERTPYGVCQIVPFMPRPIDLEKYGLGLGEVIGKTAEAMDVFYRATLGYLVRIAHPAVLVNKRLRLRQEYLRSQSGITIPVDDTNNDLKYMDPPSNPGLYQTGFGFARAMADLGTGESDVRRGQVGGSRSATEAAIAEQSGNITDRRIFSCWKRTIEQVGYVMLAVLREHITKEEAIPILGRSMPDFMYLKPEVLRGTFDIRFGGNISGSNPFQRQSAIRQIATTYAQTGELNMRELIKADTREMGESDEGRFLLRADPPMPLDPADEHIQLMAGQEIKVSPQDDDIQHITEHREFGQRLGDPYKARELFLHMQNHEQNFMLKQQQAQAGPQQGGPAPFDPSQVGQPGQPASASSRFAQLNEQRNQSNVAANGRAPGGPAPGRQEGEIARGP